RSEPGVGERQNGHGRSAPLQFVERAIGRPIEKQGGIPGGFGDAGAQLAGPDWRHEMMMNVNATSRRCVGRLRTAFLVGFKHSLSARRTSDRETSRP